MFKKYYNQSAFMFKQDKFMWERSSRVPLFFLKRSIWIHKGMHFRRKKMDWYSLSVPMGAYSFTRKPFAQPIKKEKPAAKKKRIGKI